VRVRLSKAGAIEDLIEYLADHGCVVERVGPCEVQAGSLSSLRHEYAHLDLAGHVQAWARAHPEVIAELVP
jgi:hypothetical protein